MASAPLFENYFHDSRRELYGIVRVKMEFILSRSAKQGIKHYLISWDICLELFTTKRMHSRRMRTVRSSSRLPGEGDVCPEGCLPRGCLPGWGEGGVCPVYPSIHWVKHPPWTDFLTHACENITFQQVRCGQ